VAIRVSGDVVVLPLPFAGAQWPRNVMAAGECRIRWKGSEFRAIEPRVVDGDVGRPYFSAPQRVAIRAVGIDRFLVMRRT